MKAYNKVIIQDEQIANWQKSDHGKKIQHSCLGTIKAKLKQLDNVVVLDKFIPTTKWCSKCNSVKNDLTQKDRIYICKCGHQEDRDVHAAKNMVEIYNLVISKNLVPKDIREVKLVDFRSAIRVDAKDVERQDQKVEARRCSVFS